MLVVPLAKDVIITKDRQKLRVVEYTNYKDGGPAVYAKTASKELVLIYFFDIDEINGTKVEYERGAKVFKALGKMRRAIHLPQPDDKVRILRDTISGDDDDEIAAKSRVEVKSLRLKSKALGVNKGLMFKDTDNGSFRMNEILDVDRAVGGDDFDRDAFLRLYRDYTGASK